MKSSTLIKTCAVIALVIGLVTFGWSHRAAAADYPDVMASGDSITVGTGTLNCDIGAGQCSSSYSARANLRGFGIGASCIVWCAKGYRIREWLPEYIADLSVRPSTVVLMIGTNDVPDYEATDIIAAMMDLRHTLSDRFGIRTVFGTITPAPGFECGCSGAYWNIGRTGHAKATRLAVNAWIRAYPIIQGPDYAAWLENGNHDLNPAFYSGMMDVHPNDYGAAVMGVVLHWWIEAHRD